MTNDNIVEGDEIFSMSLNVPSSLGPGVVAGPITSATGIIIDSSSKTNILRVRIIINYCNDRYQSKVWAKTIH